MSVAPVVGAGRKPREVDHATVQRTRQSSRLSVPNQPSQKGATASFQDFVSVPHGNFTQQLASRRWVDGQRKVFVPDHEKCGDFCGSRSSVISVATPALYETFCNL